MLTPFLKKSLIPLFVFITGACVLVIEIVAMRILAPYYGNTIFAVSSVISVVLAALSCGYFFGGKVVDKHPRETLFFALVGWSGVTVIVTYMLGSVFLLSAGYYLSLTSGPIIMSLLLFFVPSFLLGMLSPFAVKLQTVRMQELGVGSASGQIFFWSTLGSIFGSLSAGFFLIPTFGIGQIMLGTGALLVVLGFVSLIPLKNVWLKVGSVLLALVVVFFLMHSFFGLVGNVTSNAKLFVYAKDALYQRIVIIDGVFQGKPTRFLFQDRNPSAAMFKNSSEMVYDYTKYYALYEIFNKNVQEALVIGGGAYSVPKALLTDLPKATVEVAEIEPDLLAISEEYFDVPSDPRLVNKVEDGRRLLYDSDKKYDLIFSDAYSSLFSTPSHLMTEEFFELAKGKLSSRGVFIANVIGNLSGKAPSVALSELKTFKKVFDNSYFFAVTSPTSGGEQNLIFVGYNGSEKIDFGKKEITSHKNPIISGLKSKQIAIDKYDFSHYALLTDNYSPVEYLVSKEFMVEPAH